MFHDPIFTGIIFISIAEWICRVKLYHRYGRNHQRTLDRLSGIEQRLSQTATNQVSIIDVPPPYEANEISGLRGLPRDNRLSTAGSLGNLSVARSAVVEHYSEEAPSYSVTVSDEVLPTYQEATSSEYAIEFISTDKDCKK